MVCDLSRKKLPDLGNFWYEYSGLTCCFIIVVTFIIDKSLTKNFAVLTFILSRAKDAHQYFKFHDLNGFIRYALESNDEQTHVHAT